MAECPNCGFELGAGFRFCPACAMPLATPRTEVREERKIVSVLFVDRLIGPLCAFWRAAGRY